MEMAPENTGGSFEFTLVKSCAVNCRVCPQQLLKDSYKGTKKYMSFSDFKKILEKLPKEVRIDFSGMAEPFLNPQAGRIIEHAARTRERVVLYTTLVGAGKKDMDIIKSNKLEQLVIHFPSKEDVGLLREGTLFLEKLRYLAEGNINYLDGIFITPPSPDFRNEVERILGRKIMSAYLIDRAGNVEVNDPGVNKIRSKIMGPIACSASGRLLNRNVVFPNGDVTMCNMDYGLTGMLGNILESSYEEIIIGEKHKDLVERMKDDSKSLICRFCTVAVKWKE